MAEPKRPQSLSQILLTGSVALLAALPVSAWASKGAGAIDKQEVYSATDESGDFTAPAVPLFVRPLTPSSDDDESAAKPSSKARKKKKVAKAKALPKKLRHVPTQLAEKPAVRATVVAPVSPSSDEQAPLSIEPITVPTQSAGVAALPVRAAAPAVTGEDTPPSGFDQVPPEQTESILERLRLVGEIVQKYGRAYDYRLHTIHELETILASLETKSSSGQQEPISVPASDSQTQAAPAPAPSNDPMDLGMRPMPRGFIGRN